MVSRRERGRRWEDARGEGEEVHSPATIRLHISPSSQIPPAVHPQTNHHVFVELLLISKEEADIALP